MDYWHEHQIAGYRCNTDTSRSMDSDRMKFVRERIGMPPKKVVDFGCLPSGHIVLGDNKDISQLEVGDRVLTSQGYEFVKKTYSRPYHGKLLTVTPSGCLPFAVTPEHPILVVPMRWRYINRKLGKRKTIGRQKWIAASKLRPRGNSFQDSEYLVMPKLNLTIDPPTFPLQYERPPPKRCGRFSVKITPEFAELCGLYIAEGSASTCVELSLGTHEKQLIEDVSALIIQSTPYIPSIRIRGNVARITFGGSAIARFFSEQFGRGSHLKRVPDWMMSAPRNILMRCIRGIWKGDGTFVENWSKNGGYRFRLSITTVSKILVLQLQHALTKLGIFARIYSSKSRNGSINGRVIRGGPSYMIGISARNSIISVRSLFGVSLKEREHIQQSYLEDDKNFYIPVHKIEASNFDGASVHNFQVDSGQYLISNVVVHNCSDGSLSVELTQRGFDVIGVDFPEVIKFFDVIGRNLPVKFYALDLDQPFSHHPALECDVGVCLEIIEHLLRDYDFLVNVHSLLKPDGYIIVSTPLANTIALDDHHLRFYPENSLIKLLKCAGYQRIEVIKGPSSLLGVAYK